MNKLIAALFILLGLASAALAQNTFDSSTQATSFFNATQAITRVITAVPGKRIYLTQMTATGLDTAVVTISRGTGTNCGTGTVVILTVTFSTANPFFTSGSGASTLAVVGPGVDVCITVATAVATGWLSWSQF